MWSKPLLCRFRRPEKNQQTQVSQGFAAFRLALSRIPPRHSQSKRATNCATPRYYSFLLFARLPYSPGLRSPITPTVYWIFRRKSTAGAPFLPAAKSKGRDLLRSLSLREMFCGFTGGNYLASTSAMWPMRSSSLLL